ncbi:MAG TPA: hypothetical protein EYH39_03845 [Desulfurobacteriaceae bacterium]|nr:hypothetical protein [Desulfurobacteriaceae bacterium]
MKLKLALPVLALMSISLAQPFWYGGPGCCWNYGPRCWNWGPRCGFWGPKCWYWSPMYWNGGSFYYYYSPSYPKQDKSQSS